MRKLGRLVAGVAAVLSAWPSLAQTTALSPAEWYSAYARDGRLVQIGPGRALNLYCVGTGSPTVVLEAGIAGGAYDWRSVQHWLAEKTQVCAYDRAGMGRSPAGPLPRDTRTEVAELRALMKAAAIPGPYVLVGHSKGGLNARLYASLHRREVAGLVLVDPSVEHQIPILHAAAPAVARNDEQQIAQLRACADPNRSEEMASNCTRRAPEGFAPELGAAYVKAHGLTFMQALVAEVDAFLSVASDQVVAERRSFGRLPMVVLTRGERSSNLSEKDAATEWTFLTQMHGEIARLSTIGSHRVVAGAGHYIQLDKPDAVVETVSEVVDAARRR